MSKVGLVKQLKQQGMLQEDIDKQLQLTDAQKEETAKTDLAKELVISEEIQAQETQVLKEQVTVLDKVDVETLKLQLVRIKGNLKRGPKSHRSQLLLRKAQVIALLREEGIEVE